MRAPHRLRGRLRGDDLHLRPCARGAENVILTDLSDNVTEGAGFNVFTVEGGRVFTPDRGVLEGITRRSAIELCAELGALTQRLTALYWAKHTDPAWTTPVV